MLDTVWWRHEQTETATCDTGSSSKRVCHRGEVQHNTTGLQNGTGKRNDTRTVLQGLRPSLSEQAGESALAIAIMVGGSETPPIAACLGPDWMRTAGSHCLPAYRVSHRGFMRHIVLCSHVAYNDS